MTVADLDVIGIGNAIVDVLVHTDEEFLQEYDLDKGSMTLVDADRAQELYAQVGPAIEVSGGSAANTMVGIASLGGKCGYIGKVRDDDFGAVFRHDIVAGGVGFDTPAATDGPPTARCLVLVTPDAQRTMQTFLGASIELAPEDIDPVLLARAYVTYLEGYLWDPPRAKEAFRTAARISHEASRKVALSLSDPFCVDRHRADFLELITAEIDILFANEREITSLFQVSDFDSALQCTRAHCEIAALTRSGKGSVVIVGEEVHVVDAEPVDDVVDTTGAGDQYAAGFLFGMTQGYGPETWGRLGGIAAAEVISHLGARPEVRLADLIAAKID